MITYQLFNRRGAALRRGTLRWAFLLGAAVFTLLSMGSSANARPSPKKSKSSNSEIQTFLRQTNVYSNIEFAYTNRGVLFYAGNGDEEGCFWPRGSGDSYLFGGGLWFGTKKDLQGKLHQLCELGYNPNSGAGWYIEGEVSQVGLATTTDGANYNNKYISYDGPRYDKVTGQYLPGSSTVVASPAYGWPLWDTSSTKTLNHNYYFGDYIFDTKNRGANGNGGTLTKNGKPAKPAITSEEDIVNIYTDQNTADNPEFIAGTGYPFGLDIQEEIYSWSFGRYRDMIFIRYKVYNHSEGSEGRTTLYDCYLAPAFDPDLDASAPGAAGDDANSFVDNTFVNTYCDPGYESQLDSVYIKDASKLNMGVQWRRTDQPPNGQQYGWIGFSFLESPVVDSSGTIVRNDDSVDLGGYGPNSLFQKQYTTQSPSGQLGLTTFQDWTIANDPSTGDLRYSFVSQGIKQKWNGAYGDQRLLMATGPFTLPPDSSVETVVAIDIAQVDNLNYKKNCGACLVLADFAHQVFGQVDSAFTIADTGSSQKPDTTVRSYFVNHFVSPAPPNLPSVTTTSLQNGVFVMWDSSAERSVLNVLPTAALLPDTAQPFLGYELWRSTRSDHDSTIRPDGNNPDIMLGKWQLWNYDSTIDTITGNIIHYHYTRINTTPNAIPHSYLDVGDDNHSGNLGGTVTLYDNVPYYYYVIAFNEYDSLNQVGPLYTAVVQNKNFVTGTPSRPPYLIPFASDTATDLNSCVAGNGNTKADLGGLTSIQLQVSDTGIFQKLFCGTAPLQVIDTVQGKVDTSHLIVPDTVNVSFEPRWTEYADNVLDESPMNIFVDVTDTRNGVQNTYTVLQNPANNTVAYSFPTSTLLDGAPSGTIVAHVDGTYTADSTFGAQFTTSDLGFAPNQTIDQAFSVLVNMNLEQDSGQYRLSKVQVVAPSGADPNILRLSRRTNNSLGNYDSTQNIYNLPPDSAQRPPVALTSKQITIYGPLAIGQVDTGYVPGSSNDTIYTLADTVRSDTDNNGHVIGYVYNTSTPYYHYTINSTRPSFLGSLGATTYQVLFAKKISPGPIPIVDNGTTIYPDVDSVVVSIEGCDSSILRPTMGTTFDTTNNMVVENDWRFYVDHSNKLANGTPYPNFDDPDSLIDPNPGWYTMTAWHYVDQVDFSQQHSGASFVGQGGNLGGTVGPYYFPIGTDANPGGNLFTSGGQTNYLLAVHRLNVGGAEIIFNAPEIYDQGTTGDSIALQVPNHLLPHENDFQPNDKVLISFTGIAKNLPFPGAQFHILTPSTPAANISTTSNYVDSILNQVQVVPNPYIVTNLAQISTDQAKLFFTRLPPRCTIEIYGLDGTLIQTLEHTGYQSTVTQDVKNIAALDTTYNYSQLADQATVQTWNLLTNGGQLVGSQVLFARIVAKDPNSGAETGEATTKFAVVVGLTK